MSPFNWKCLQIDTQRAKDLRENLAKLQKGGLIPVPLALLVIRVVLLLWSYGPYKGFSAELYEEKKNWTFATALKSTQENDRSVFIKKYDYC